MLRLNKSESFNFFKISLYYPQLTSNQSDEITFNATINENGILKCNIMSDESITVKKNIIKISTVICELDDHALQSISNDKNLVKLLTC